MHGCAPAWLHAGGRLRRDVLAAGGVAPVASTPQALRMASAMLGGAEEKFAFARAVSRLCEMQSAHYLSLHARPRIVAHGQQWLRGQEDP